MQQRAMNGHSVLFKLCLALVWCFSTEATALVKRRTSLQKVHEDIASTASPAKVDAEKDDDGDDDENDEDDEKWTALTKDVTVAQAALDNNLADQKNMRVEINHLENKKASDQEIDANAKLVAKETESEALGGMMGNMWKELRMFEVPTYAKHAQAEIASAAKAEVALSSNLKKAKARLSEYDAEDDKEDGKTEKAESKPNIPVAKTDSPKKAADLKEPESESPEILPVPTTSRCIIVIVIQYMVVHMALALCRTYCELTSREKGMGLAGLEAAAQTLTYGPMICVLFIACRMRVEFLSHGEGQPQMWVQNCMYALTFAVLASTILVLFVPMVAGKVMTLREGSCDLETPANSARGPRSYWVFYVLTTLRYLILLGLYGGIAGVIVGIFMYLPPGATSVHDLPSPAPAVMCTMILAVLFFFFQLVIVMCTTYTEFTGVSVANITEVMSGAVSTVEFAPQLAILFLAARMRALQHNGQPQEWAQSCMYSSTIALCLTATLACLVPWFLGGSMRTHPINREATFHVPNPLVGIALVALRFLCMVYFYGGAMGVIYSIFSFESPKGPEHTLPVSPTVHCVINLTCQFFFIYFVQTTMLIVSEITAGQFAPEKYKFFTALEAAKTSLAFAPMLSIMFVTTRMYALLITDNKGAPQAWVQDGMYMATWSLLISFLCCLGTGMALDKVETDEDGNVTNKFSNKYVMYSFVAVRYLAMVLLYGGILCCIVGLLVMTPETANGRGSVPVLSDAIDKTPMGRPPPNANDISDAGGAAASAADSK